MIQQTYLCEINQLQKEKYYDFTYNEVSKIVKLLESRMVTARDRGDRENEVGTKLQFCRMRKISGSVAQQWA